MRRGQLIVACLLSACPRPSASVHPEPEAPAATAAQGAPSEPAVAPLAQPTAVAAPPADHGDEAPRTPERIPDPEVFHQAIRDVVQLPWRRGTVRAARSHRMRIQNLSWEDAGRNLGSAWGPNISDLTLEVHEHTTSPSGRRRTRTHLLPVLRYPNFTDRTADIPSDRFWIRVGNERAGAAPDGLRPVPLTDLVAHLRDYLSAPDSLRSDSDDFSAPRDTHYLVSAQHVFVPLPQGARVEWAPVLFNYQSGPGSPAVLCVVVTREGTSIQIIENRPDPLHPDGWGQRLYFNHGGQRTLFTAERVSGIAERIERGEGTAEDATATEEGSDMVLLVQIPLRVSPRSGGGAATMASGSLAGLGRLAERPASDVERAAIGHGLEEGPLREVGRTRIRRDPRFPIRVTVQFYRATSNGVVTEEDIAAAAAQIERVYSEADFVGSLVVGSEERPTSWVRPGPLGPA